MAIFFLILKSNSISLEVLINDDGPGVPEEVKELLGEPYINSKSQEVNSNSGTGLGLKFLGHVEKCKVLLHFLDCSKKNIKKNYEIIREELSKYGSGLKEKKEILVLTKSDLISDIQADRYSKQLKNYFNKNVISISINDLNSLIALKKLLLSEKNKNKQFDTGKWQP